jgi:hypothetical protein
VPDESRACSIRPNWRPGDFPRPVTRNDGCGVTSELRRVLSRCGDASVVDPFATGILTSDRRASRHVFIAAAGRRSIRRPLRSLGWRRRTLLPAADCSALKLAEARAPA